jgi:hypothetical protein
MQLLGELIDTQLHGLEKFFAQDFSRVNSPFGCFFVR